MKVLVYKNNLKVDVSDDFAKAREYFARHNVTLDFEFVESGITDFKVKEQNFGSVGFRYQITGHEDKLNLSKDYITVFCFNGNQFHISKMPTSRCNKTENGILVTLMTYKEGDVVGETYLTLIHELMHALFYHLSYAKIQLNDPMDIFFRQGKWLQYFNNDRPDDINSNFGEAWRLLTPHLHHFGSTPKYKYFKESEVRGLKPEFVQLLDKARGISGVPFRITSGYRSPSHNESVGGVESSSHTTGLAVDLAVADSVTGAKILLALVQVGFTRFGFYKDGHIHVDLDNSKPNPCYWIK